LTGTIDIWWIVADGGILLLLPFLLQKHRVWQSCSLRLFALASDEEDPDLVKGELQRYLSDFRLNVEVRVKSVNTTILKAVSKYTARAVDSPRAGKSISSAQVTRIVSSGPFANWRRQAGDDESLERPRATTSGVFSMLSGNRPGFPELPPGNNTMLTSSISRTAPSCDAPMASVSSCSIPVEGEGVQGIHPTITMGGRMEMSVSSDPAETKEVEGLECSIEDQELELVKGLNKIIQSESENAELVVTNLPDMPPGESIIGYFTLIEELTKGLQRCLLARGTATEVITAFT